jgi:uncharacterized protein YecE (DUF72 family)
MPPELHIGCSGFNYREWKENFYPALLPQKKWFEYYCTVFRTVELNVTFYRLPLASTFDKWYNETPSDFIFSLKGSRYISHVKKLLDPEKSLDLFFERALQLKHKLKVVLWQFSPGFKAVTERLQKFLELLQKYPVRNTLEFRHESWLTEETMDMCRKYNVCLCMADWPEFIDDLPATSGFVYIRRHGPGGRYDAAYSEDELKKDAKRIKVYLKDKKDVFIYFNNDAYGYAPGNAGELLEIMK